MSVSTFSLSSSNQSIAFEERLCPSKLNGRVTTPTVRAPSSFAISATIGAAHVPVPQPSPQVINTISAPSRCCLISSRLSSAAFFQTSGLLHAPSHPVIIFPRLIFVSASELYIACTSVFITIKSTPSSPHSIIRFTAFPHPHQTQTTLIFATGEIFPDSEISSGQLCGLELPLLESKLRSLSSRGVIVKKNRK